jgi:hypothetical protein
MAMRNSEHSTVQNAGQPSTSFTPLSLPCLGCASCMMHRQYNQSSRTIDNDLASHAMQTDLSPLVLGRWSAEEKLRPNVSHQQPRR